MTPPNYFLADLPPGAELTAAMITEACQTLRRNRERYLATRSTPSIIGTVSALAREWRRPECHFRKIALEPAKTDFGRTTLANGLDAFFSELTPENLEAVVSQDLGHAQRLDRFVSTAREQGAERCSLAIGPPLLVHITAGNLPVPALMSMVLGLLVRSAQFVKCASGSAFLSRLFAHSLYEAEPKLGACLEIAEWPGGRAQLEEALYAEADYVTATGSDETIAAIRRTLPSHVRFVAYGHRVSFGYVAQEMMTSFSAKKIAAQAANDVAAWNQLGCLSPHVFYVEHGGAVTPEQFAEMLAMELAQRETAEPRGPIPTEQAATIASRRAFYHVRAAASPETPGVPETRCWHSDGSTAWTVVYEADPRFQVSCLNRFIYVKGAANVTDALHHADSVRGQVSTVGLAAYDDTARTLATQLARWGVTRVCPLGQMQNPLLTWRHDGRPPLGDLVQWTNWER